MTIATDYSSPRVHYLNTIDYIWLLRRWPRVYLFGDLNARHRRLFNSSGDNIVGNTLAQLHQMNLLQYLGPDFPMLIRNNCFTSPDIALANSRTFHNIYLTPGPVTSSDHIPVIITISSNLIQIPIRPRTQFANSNWHAFQQEFLNIPPLIPTTWLPMTYTVFSLTGFPQWTPLSILPCRQTNRLHQTPPTTTRIYIQPHQSLRPHTILH